MPYSVTSSRQPEDDTIPPRLPDRGVAVAAVGRADNQTLIPLAPIVLVHPLVVVSRFGDPEANQNFAKALKGRLMLAHGTMDTNVPPYQTMLIADALIKANKDFDLLMIPNANHGYGAASTYMMRRRWDFFVKWLMGTEPPPEHDFAAPTGRGGPPL